MDAKRADQAADMVLAGMSLAQLAQLAEMLGKQVQAVDRAIEAQLTRQDARLPEDHGDDPPSVVEVYRDQDGYSAMDQLYNVMFDTGVLERRVMGTFRILAAQVLGPDNPYARGMIPPSDYSGSDATLAEAAAACHHVNRVGVKLSGSWNELRLYLAGHHWTQRKGAGS